MTTPKFTPGPWKTTRRTFNYGCYGHEISTTEDSQRVFVTPRRPEIATIHSDEDEDRANAHLIASAPALYAALEDTAYDCCDIRLALQSPVMTASEKLAMIQKLVDKSRDARQSSLALARGEKGGDVK